MSDGDASLDQALSQLSEAADIIATEEVEEVARVRKARAGVTEHARQSGDNAESLLSSLIGESNAELEAEKEELARLAREKEEKEKAEAEAEVERKRQEAADRLAKEKKLLEEKEQRRLKMLADLEKKRKLEAGEVDEEEEARKRAEKEAEEARIAEQKAREEAEAAALSSDNEILAEQIRSIKSEQKAREEAEAAAAHKKKIAIISGLSILAILIIGWITFFFLTLKAPDFYTLRDDYPTKTLTMDSTPFAGFNEKAVAFQVVTQEAPKKASSGRKKDNKDIYKIGNATDVLSTNKIVK